MSIIKTPAIVIKCNEYRETSKLLTLYTLTHGKIRCIAKGVRKTNSRWGGCLQSLAYLSILFYYKENRNLNLLSNAEYVNLYSDLINVDEKLKIGYRIIELVDKTTIEYHENQNIFNLLVNSLRSLNHATKNYVNVLFKFEFSLANLLGFAIDLEKMSKRIYFVPNNSLENTVNHSYYISGTKNMVESDETIRDSSVILKDYDIKFLELLRNGNFVDIFEYNLLNTSVYNIDRYLELYFREHIENLGILKTKRILKS